MGSWMLDDIPWDRFDRARVEPALLAIVKAASLGDEAWLYVVYGCAGVAPELQRVRNPANVLRHRISGHAVIERGAVVSSSTLDN